MRLGRIDLLAAILGLAGTLSACGRPALPPSLLQAQQMERAGHLEQALAAYERASVECPDPGEEVCGQVRLHRAEALVALRRGPEALSAYQSLAAWTRVPFLAGLALVRGGRQAEALGKQAQALALYRRTLHGFPDEVAAEEALRRLVSLTDPGSLAALAQELFALYATLSNTSLGPRLLFEAAALYRRQGHSEQALTLYRRIQAAHPKSTLLDDSLWLEGQLLETLDRTSEAISAYGRLVRGRKQTVLAGTYNSVFLDDAKLRIGQLQLEQMEKPDEAIRTFRELCSEFKDSTLCDDARLWQARAQFRTGDRDAACATLARLRLEAPDSNQLRAVSEDEGAWGCPEN